MARTPSESHEEAKKARTCATEWTNEIKRERNTFAFDLLLRSAKGILPSLAQRIVA